MSDDIEIATVLLDGLASKEGDAAEIAAFLQNSLTLIETVPASFLKRYGIFAVMPRHLSRPILRHVAGGEGLPTHILSADPESMADVLRADGSTLDDADHVTSYAEVLLEVVSPQPGLTRVVGSFDEIPFKETPDDAESAAMATAETSLGSRVRPPAATRTEVGWSVEMWVARDGGLDREVLRLGDEGELLGQEVEESHDLPLILVA